MKFGFTRKFAIEYLENLQEDSLDYLDEEDLQNFKDMSNSELGLEIIGCGAVHDENFGGVFDNKNLIPEDYVQADWEKI